MRGKARVQSHADPLYVSRCAETSPRFRNQLRARAQLSRGAPLGDCVQALRAEGAFRVDVHSLALAAALRHRHLAAATVREPRTQRREAWRTRAAPGT